MAEPQTLEIVRRFASHMREATKALATFGQVMASTAADLNRSLESLAPPRIGQRVTWTDDFGRHNGVVVGNLYAGRICVKPDGTEQTGAIPRPMLTKI
jgi:hypothetical protein